MEEKAKNCYLIDWFSASCKLDDYTELYNHLGFYGEECNAFKDGYGHHGYTKCVYYNGIYIYYDYPAEPGRVWLEMSGTGCRTFETLADGVTFIDLFRLCLGEDPFFTVNRVDLAYDIYDDPLLFDRVKNASESGCIVSQFGQAEIQESYNLIGGSYTRDYIGRTLYFGSAKSELRFRLYDKRLERKRDDLSSWYRLEMVFRRSLAVEFIDNLFSYPDINMGSIFQGYVDHYLRVVERSKDSNYRRWSTPDWWSRFVFNASCIHKLEKKTSSYNILNAQYLVQNMYGNTIDVILETLGISGLVQLVEERESNLTYDQVNAIRAYKMQQGSDSVE